MRGYNAAAYVFIGLIVVGMLGGLGFYSAAGIDITTSGDDEVTTVQEQYAGDKEVQAQGASNPTGYTNSALDSFTALWGVVTQTEALARALSVHPAAAGALQAMGVFAFAGFLGQMVRGVVFE